MSTENINIGDRVEISMEKTPPANWDDAYVTKVETVKDNNTIIIHAPFKKGQLVKLPLNVICITRISTKSGFYLCEAKAIEYLTEDGLNIVAMQIVGEFEKTQQRNFFRLACAIPITYYILNENGELASNQAREGLIRDVGGGGMRMLSKEQLDINISIRLELQLEKSSLMMFGQVLRKDDNPRAVYPYQYRVRFTAMSSTEQDKLVHFIYQEQRKILSRS